MSNLVRTQRNEREQTLQERLRARLVSQSSPRAHGHQVPRTSCLLLDVSGSMNDYLGANTKKIDELRKLAQGFQDVRRFQFSTTARELGAMEEVGDPRGGTCLDRAFIELKRVGIVHTIILTDGKPDHEGRALEAAKGLKIDVFYVGPDPAPEFLRRLAESSGGQYGKASLTMVKELSAGVRALLGPGRTAG